MSNKKTLLLVQLSLFTAIELLFCFTPLGSIPITAGIVATLAHIPALIAALTLGKKAGGFIGVVMGISALIIWSMTPPNPAVAFAFSPFAPNGNIFSLIICVVPRVLFPVFCAIIFERLKNKIQLVPAAAIAASVATFIHSALVLSGIYIVFRGNEFVGGNYIDFIVAWAGVNAIIELVIAGVVAAAIITPLYKYNQKNNLTA